MKLHTNIKYRPDIDGLRAIAVLSVILFHINPNWIPGGFLGVDIFFVISGYLITLILTKEVDSTNKINVAYFYKRRIKRIIPALLFVLVSTYIVGFLIFTPDALLSLSKSMIWSFFSAANIYFFSSIDTGYFAAGSSELPLLHLWSLGVEEQFYILWPFTVLLLLKYVNSLPKKLIITSMVFIASFVWAQSVIISNHSFAYYMLPTRAWELLAGAIVALLVHSGFRTKNLFNELIATVGLLMIILSFVFVTESDPVPGLAALPAILGSSLLVLSGISYKTYVGRILSHKLFVAIGLVSYSAYLWHWPILAYLRYALIEINLAISIGVVLLTFTMATVSYFLIETPLRKNNFSTKKIIVFYFILPAIIIVTISTITIQAIEHKNPWIFPWEKLNSINTTTLSARDYEYSCDFSNEKIFYEDRCVYPAFVKNPDAFLIGDSNAAHHLGMIRAFANEYGFSLRNATRNACPLILDGEFDWISANRREACSQYRREIYEQAIKYDTVIIGVSWNYYYNKKDFKKRFENTIDILSKNINNIIILGKIPIFPSYNKECKVKSIRLDDLQCVNRFNNKFPEDRANIWLRQIANKYSNIDYFDIRGQICKDGVCSPYINETPVYFNAGHLSMKGSEYIGERMLNDNSEMLEVFKSIKKQKQMFHTHIKIISENENIKFILKPNPKNKLVAFYLFKNNKRIDTQWYSENFSYVLNKNKHGNGIYKVSYFIIDKDKNNEKKEIGYSETIEIDSMIY